jgi:hypothetical protein
VEGHFVRVVAGLVDTFGFFRLVEVQLGDAYVFGVVDGGADAAVVVAIGAVSSAVGAVGLPA